MAFIELKLIYPSVKTSKSSLQMAKQSLLWCVPGVLSLVFQHVLRKGLCHI